MAEWKDLLTAVSRDAELAACSGADSDTSMAVMKAHKLVVAEVDLMDSCLAVSLAPYLVAERVGLRAS